MSFRSTAPSVVVTKDGATIVGRLLNQDAFSIQLMNADEQLKSYSRSNLREHTIVTKGLMPSYEGKLTSRGDRGRRQLPGVAA